MLNLCAAHGIAADLEIIPIQKISEGFARVVAGDARYRFVIEIASLQ